MKKLFCILAFAALVWLPTRAHAYQEVVEVYRSSATVGRVVCTTGTAVQLDATVNTGILGSGFNRSAVRVVNQDSSNNVWLGFTSSVSSNTASNFLGELVQSNGSNATYQVGNAIPIYCIAANGAGAGGAVVSIAQFGYK